MYESSSSPKLTARGQSIDAAHTRLAEGDVLLLFPEGTRSRTAAMQPFLAGAARYLELPETCVVPIGMTGPEELFPIDDTRLRPAMVTASIGRPMRADDIRADAHGDRQQMMDAIGRAIAALLPPTYRGFYGHGRQNQ
jgi:1-acyl-sn-glycerol-3-phosphate acyltransferase